MNGEVQRGCATAARVTIAVENRFGQVAKSGERESPPIAIAPQPLSSGRALAPWARLHDLE